MVGQSNACPRASSEGLLFIASITITAQGLPSHADLRYNAPRGDVTISHQTSDGIDHATIQAVTREAVDSGEPASTNWWFYVKTAPFLALVALELDQISKLWVRESLALAESIPGEGSLRITHAVNPGVVFGIPASPVVSLIVPLVAILACLVIFWRFERSNNTMLNIGTGLFVGGSLGNLVDRIAHGQVTDFIGVVLSGGKVAIIFNLADICVVLGLVMLEVFLIGVIIGTIRKKGPRYHPVASAVARHITRRGSTDK